MRRSLINKSKKIEDQIKPDYSVNMKNKRASLYTISDAKIHLSELLVQVSKGQEIIIGRAGHPIAKLVQYVSPTPKRTPGLLRGKIIIQDHFDSLSDDINSAFGMDT